MCECDLKKNSLNDRQGTRRQIEKREKILNLGYLSKLSTNRKKIFSSCNFVGIVSR